MGISSSSPKGVNDFCAGVAEMAYAPDLESGGAPSKVAPCGFDPRPRHFSFYFMGKPRHTEGVPRPGNNVKIPLPFREALRGLLKVKPTDDMPRPGAHPTAPKKKRTTKHKG